MGSSPTRGSSSFLRKSDCLGCALLPCLVVCLTLLASLILPSFSSLIAIACSSCVLSTNNYSASKIKKNKINNYFDDKCKQCHALYVQGYNLEINSLCVKQNFFTSARAYNYAINIIIIFFWHPILKIIFVVFCVAYCISARVFSHGLL